MQRYFWVVIALVFYSSINTEAQNNLPSTKDTNTGIFSGRMHNVSRRRLP